MPTQLHELVEERLNDYLARGLLINGGQTVVIQGGVELANVAIGTDHLIQPLRPEHLSCVYCVSKVPLYVSFLALMESGVVQLNSKIGSLLPDANPWVADCTIQELLSQRGGFFALPGPVSRFVPEQMRRVSHQWLSEPRNNPRGTQAYSVSEVGWLVALMLERATDTHYSELLPRMVSQAIGPEAMPSQTGPLAVGYQRESPTSDPLPLLNEATRAVRSQWNPSLGWYSSATGIARLGAALNDAWHGRANLGSGIVQYATTPQSEPVFDVGLGREASFGLGFWTHVSSNGYGSAMGPKSFAHHAQGGTAFMAVDPERELVVAGIFDNAIEDDTGLGLRRAPLVDLIVEAVDG